MQDDKEYIPAALADGQDEVRVHEALGAAKCFVLGFVAGEAACVQICSHMGVRWCVESCMLCIDV